MEHEHRHRESDTHDGAVRALHAYAELFVQRRDTYARQREQSRRYYRVRQPLTDDVLYKHLRGEITIGLYSLDQHGMTRWSVIDSDRGIQPLQEVQTLLAEQQMPSFLELSRAGGHLWIFWRSPIHPDQAKKILSPSVGTLELFPSGDIPDEDGVGLLIRAPLGIHRFTGQRYPFVDRALRPVSPGRVRGQIDWLARHVERVDPPVVLEDTGQEMGTRSPLWRPHANVTGADQGPIAQWLVTHDIRNVVGEYMRLSRSGLGHCPWPEQHKHGDRHPSFAIFEKTQKWWCFTERLGGNAFDFLCRYHGVDAREMLRRFGR